MERVTRINDIKIELARCDGHEVRSMLEDAYARKAEAERDIEMLEATLGERIGRIALLDSQLELTGVA